jgi:hypothetical protein
MNSFVLPANLVDSVRADASPGRCAWLELLPDIVGELHGACSCGPVVSGQTSAATCVQDRIWSATVISSIRMPVGGCRRGSVWQRAPITTPVRSAAQPALISRSARSVGVSFGPRCQIAGCPVNRCTVG